MQMVAADWLKSNKREDDLGGRPGSIVQVYCAINCTASQENFLLNAYFYMLQKCGAQGGTEFFFIVHIQVTGYFYSLMKRFTYLLCIPEMSTF